MKGTHAPTWPAPAPCPAARLKVASRPTRRTCSGSSGTAGRSLPAASPPATAHCCCRVKPASRSLRISYARRALGRGGSPAAEDGCTHAMMGVSGNKWFGTARHQEEGGFEENRMKPKTSDKLEHGNGVALTACPLFVWVTGVDDEHGETRYIVDPNEFT